MKWIILIEAQITIMSDVSNYEQVYKTALLLNPNAQITNGDFVPTRRGELRFAAYSGMTIGNENRGARVGSQGYQRRKGRNAPFGAISPAPGSVDSNTAIIKSVVK